MKQLNITQKTIPAFLLSLNQFCLLVITISALAMSACQKDDDIDPPFEEPQNLEEAIANIFQPMIEGDTTVGVSVGIINGSVTKQFFFGEKEKGIGELPDENTIYEIGSITKTMTGALLADMVLNEEISLDDAVEGYLPEIADFPSYNGSKITFRHLADHTSSLPRLPDNFDGGNFVYTDPYANYTKAMLYESLNGYELPYAPGTVEEYSNLGLGLLGHLISEIRGISLQQQFEEAIFNVAAFENTFINVPDDKTNIAQPYDEEFAPVPMWTMTEVTLGAGGVKSTLKDMLRYTAINLGQIQTPLNPALELTHETSQALNYPFVNALVWPKIIKEEDNTALIWHNGGTGGTVSFIGFIKELGIGVVLLFNTEVNDRTGSQPVLELLKGIEVIDAIKKY